MTAVYYVTMALKQKAALYIYVAGFVFLSVYHIQRMIESKAFVTPDYASYDMDLTLILMQQLIRVTYFAWAVHDTLVPDSELPEGAKGRVIKDKVTLLDFLSYNFNFLGLVCPSPDFCDYMDFIHERGNYAVVPVKKYDHLIIARNFVCAAAFYLLCNMFLYKPTDVVTPKVTDKVCPYHLEHRI